MDCGICLEKFPADTMKFMSILLQFIAKTRMPKVTVGLHLKMI